MTLYRGSKNANVISGETVATTSDIEEAVETTEGYRDDAFSAKNAAQSSENSAETSANNASTSETNAANSESAASTSEANAATSESNALTSENNAATSEGNALASENKAQGYADTINTTDLKDRANHTGTQLLSTISNSGTAASKDVGTGSGEVALSDSSVVKILGESFALRDDLTGVSAPDNSGSAKFIRLTAGQDGTGGYNEGLLINETLSGSAPLLDATAEIATGPLAGQIVNLLNTEGRYLQPGESSGTVANDQMQQITGEIQSINDSDTAVGFSDTSGLIGAFGGRDPSNRTFTAKIGGVSQATLEVTEFDSANSPNARTGNHTNVKHQQATYYMRIA